MNEKWTQKEMPKEPVEDEEIKDKIKAFLIEYFNSKSEDRHQGVSFDLSQKAVVKDIKNGDFEIEDLWSASGDINYESTVYIARIGGVDFEISEEALEKFGSSNN